MKKIKIEKKFYTKIAALILGMIVWVIIINVEDADFSIKRSNIEVQISGEAVLARNNLVISNKGELEDASILIRGKRSDVINYMDSISAAADVSKITEPGEYKIKVTYESPTNAIYVTDRKSSTVKVIAEKLQKKEVEVLVLQKGESADTGKIIESVPAIKKVTVQATAADLEKIAYMAVEVDVTGMLVDSVQELALIPIDAEKKPLTFKNSVYYSDDKTEVENTVHSQLTVPVTINVKSNTHDAFIISSQSLEKIDVGIAEGGELQEVIGTVHYSSDIGTEYTVKLTAEEGVYIPPESSEVMVKLKVVPKVTKTVTVPLGIENGTGRRITAPEQVEVEVTGAEEEISAGNISASVNVGKLGSGTHNLAVKVELKRTSLALVRSPEVELTIE